MANTGRITGKDAYVSFGGTAISGDFTSISFEQNYDLADVTAGADAYHYSIPVRAGDYSVKVESFFDAASTAPWNTVVPGNEGTLIVAPYGTAAGRPKFTWARVVVESRSMDIPFDDGVTCSASFRVSSALTNGTW